MTDDEKIAGLFSEIMEIPLNELNDSISYNSYPTWDSLRHLQLIAELEDEFNIEFCLEDITSMKTYKEVKEFTRKYLQ